MARPGTMTPDQLDQTVPDFSQLTDHSLNYPAGAFPYRSDGLASDITEEDRDHWRKHSTAGIGLAHFHQIILKLEELRFARRLLEEVTGTGSSMSRCDSSEAKGSPGPGDSHSPYSDNGDRVCRECRQNRPRSPRLKGSHRIRKEEDSINLDTVFSDLAEEQREISDPLDAGPIRSQLCSARHQPYAMNEERLSRSPRSHETIALSYESTAERILQHKEYSEKLNPCLDQLESSASRTIQVTESRWDYGSNTSKDFQERTLPTDSRLPSIVIDDPREESFFSEVFPHDPLSNLTQVHPEPGISTSRISTYNIVTSKSGSCGSSRAQSPGSLLNLENPMTHNAVYSPVGSPQFGLGLKTQGQSSSESSNQSYSDTPSPHNYQTPVNPRLEADLGNEVRRLILWNDGYDSTETMMNSNIDHTDLQLLDEVLWQDLGRSSSSEEPQVVPTSSHQTSILPSEQTSITSCSPCSPIGNPVNLHCQYTSNLPDYRRSSNTIPIPSSSNTSYLQSPSMELSAWNRTSIPRYHHFDDFEIPRIVANFETSPTRRNRERSAMPWPSLNLPLVGASERLKEGLNPKEVERAMGSLLKRTLEELARADEDGDTMLMLLVGNPEEYAKKKAYLVPLVERLSNSRDALTMTNNRGEDALYLAAMNCPKLPYVTGYLAAAMLRKGIDISQRLYHTRGDSLIHAVASRGDSHGEVLTELLALRTIQGNAVFDLSKRNYYGKTALHVAVESHTDSSSDSTSSSVRSVQLLLENGAERSTSATKCGDTALHMAISLSCDPELIKILLVDANEATVNARNRDENTPLHMAATVPSRISLERQMEVCWLLIQAGAHSNMENRRGETALALVSADRKDAIRRILYKKT